MGKLRTVVQTIDPDAIKANIAHNFLTQRGFEMIKAMIMCGEILYNKKRKLKHGQWNRWIKLNLEFSRMTANRYIRLYEHREEILAEEPGSLREALAIISDTKRVTPGLLSGDEKILYKNIVSPIKVVQGRLKRLPRDPMHYDSVVKIMHLLADALDELQEDIS
jgi:hypothetical protein